MAKNRVYWVITFAKFYFGLVSWFFGFLNKFYFAGFDPVFETTLLWKKTKIGVF